MHSTRHTYDTCSDNVSFKNSLGGVLRLIDHSSSLSARPLSAGHVEIYLDGQWGTMGVDFTQREANVVCRQLGFSGARRFGRVGDLG